MIRTSANKTKKYCKGCMELEGFLTDIALDIINLKIKLDRLDLEECKVDLLVDEFAELFIFFIEEFKLGEEDRKIKLIKNFLIDSLNWRDN